MKKFERRCILKYRHFSIQIRPFIPFIRENYILNQRFSDLTSKQPRILENWKYYVLIDKLKTCHTAPSNIEEMFTEWGEEWSLSGGGKVNVNVN